MIISCCGATVPPIPCNMLKEVLCPSPRRQKSLNDYLPGAPEISPLWKNWLRSVTGNCIAWQRPILTANVQAILCKPRRWSTKPICGW
jgi:hypothetical protein